MFVVVCSLCVVCGPSFGVRCRYLFGCFVFGVWCLMLGLCVVCGFDVWCSGLIVCDSLFVIRCLLIIVC